MPTLISATPYGIVKTAPRARVESHVSQLSVLIHLHAQLHGRSIPRAELAATLNVEVHPTHYMVFDSLSVHPRGHGAWAFHVSVVHSLLARTIIYVLTPLFYTRTISFLASDS